MKCLNNFDIVYDKLKMRMINMQKTEVCVENNIDLMIEDSTRISLDLINNGIKVYTMNTKYEITHKGNI